MSNLEDEIRDLREKNSELAKEVQTWKVLSAQKDKEKLELTKEINELRLKISRLRSVGAAKARTLDAGLQASTEEALSHLVQASGAVARTLELTKQYIQEREELDMSSPKWSHISGNTSTKKVNEVPPLLLGGQSIQPVVSLSRTMLGNRSINRSPNQNSGVTHRAVPMRMLQDVYIPLTRIDAADFQVNNMDQEENVEENNSTEDLGLEDSTEQPAEAEESQNLESTASELEESRGLDAVIEESVELDDIEETPPPRQNNIQTIADNPLEGPSWLLDVIGSRDIITRSVGRASLEPDSTTPCVTPPARSQEQADKENAPASVHLAFSPTVRRRKRTSSPPRPSFSPRPPRKHSTGRVLKVIVAKMRLSDEDPGGSGDSSPPKRPALVHSSPKSPRAENSSRRPTTDGKSGNSPRRSTIEGERRNSPQRKDGGPPRPRFDAPSPNGATDSGVIVCETHSQPARESRRDTQPRARSRAASRDDASTHSRHDCSDSDNSSAGDADSRTRRALKQVGYKEKPLNSETQSQRACESRRDTQPRARSRAASRDDASTHSRHDCSDSDNSAGDVDSRTRRARKQVSYKEKPLNKKLRR